MFTIYIYGEEMTTRFCLLYDIIYQCCFITSHFQVPFTLQKIFSKYLTEQFLDISNLFYCTENK